jgi:hypothetical protein
VGYKRKFAKDVVEFLEKKDSSAPQNIENK